ncbi:LOW QUALITY PROTEIN: hypothetical protein MAR_005566 [Mya arenaria]|uniref:Uncharacterized protein n=1 Tax=Mya arenaria TaxID=6604 RepID=A0ABY7F847_MYAAR|nr:LOW QUALITY PROTEIN: hypothetical protein MAR_005566 [Mya arenaria]
MSGFKNSNQLLVIQRTAGVTKSEINFAVPDQKVLMTYNPYSLELGKGVTKPGIAHEVIDQLSTNMSKKSYCVTFAGKKLKQGLTKVDGDIDLFELKEILDKYTLDANTVEFTVEDKTNVKETLLMCLKVNSKQCFNMMEIRKKREYAKAQMIEKRSEIYNLNRSSVFQCIKNKEADGCNRDNISTREIKQKLDFKKRRQAKVTGSTIDKAVGLDGIKRQQEHYDKVFRKLESQIPDVVQKNMDNGTANEINVTATFVNAVMPILFPNGLVDKDLNGEPFMVISPDGTRFYLQCQSEMNAFDVNSLFYLCLRPKLSSIFKMHRKDGTLDEALTIAQQLYESPNNKSPTKATEAVVFICCDIDREWWSISIRCAPVCWLTKGYSLSTGTMSNILQEVLNNCKISGLRVPAISFDGQWHDIAVRSVAYCVASSKGRLETNREVNKVCNTTNDENTQ